MTRDSDQEYQNGVTLGGRVDSEDPTDWVVINSLIEQRVLRGWPLAPWMRMRQPDGSVMPAERQQELLEILGRVRQEAREAHRRERPDCLECRAEDTS